MLGKWDKDDEKRMELGGRKDKPWMGPACGIGIISQQPMNLATNFNRSLFSFLFSSPSHDQSIKIHRFVEQWHFYFCIL